MRNCRLMAGREDDPLSQWLERGEARLDYSVEMYILEIYNQRTGHSGDIFAVRRVRLGLGKQREELEEAPCGMVGMRGSLLQPAAFPVPRRRPFDIWTKILCPRENKLIPVAISRLYPAGVEDTNNFSSRYAQEGKDGIP